VPNVLRSLTRLLHRSLDFCKFYFHRQNITNSMVESNHGRDGDYGDNKKFTSFWKNNLIFTAVFSRSLPEPPKSNVRHASALKVNFNNMLFSALTAFKKSLSSPFLSNIL